ncbi:pesticidal protein Cry7Aa [Fluviicola taffensis]|uniref:glycoside hydrolase family 130 protein n=1 Tax=Fluviicola taffensis TaxID=191579 RepID=UPI00313789E5
MVQVIKEGILLEKTAHDFESHGVLNPGAIREGSVVHLFYRAVKEGNYSSIGHCTLDGPHQIVSRNTNPILFPEFPYEVHGVEDARVCKIDDTYYLTYTAYDGKNALGSLATSQDLITFEKQGIIVPQLSYSDFEKLLEKAGIEKEHYLGYCNSISFIPERNQANLMWDKDVFFFPQRIQGKLCFLHRIKPDIQLVLIDELSDLTPEFWTSYLSDLKNNTILTPRYDHEISYIGGGAPPIETESGWLLIYHGVKCTPEGNIYSACASLLDLHDPKKEIARLNYPLFEPEYPWELKGEVDNVCFPCGTTLFGDTLYIYYGAADEQIAYASLSLSELISELKLNTIKDETV